MNRKIDRTVHPPRILRKTYWDEDEHQRWKLSRSSARPRAGGRLRRFPRRVLLQVLFSIHQAKSELTRSELLRLFQDDLVSNRVLAKGAERPALSRPLAILLSFTLVCAVVDVQI